MCFVDFLTSQSTHTKRFNLEHLPFGSRVLRLTKQRKNVLGVEISKIIDFKQKEKCRVGKVEENQQAGIT